MLLARVMPGVPGASLTMFSKSCSVRSNRALTWAIPAFATLARQSACQHSETIQDVAAYIVLRSPSSLTLVCTIFSTSAYLLTSAIAKQAFRPRPSISLTTSLHPASLAGMSFTQIS